MMSKDTSAGKDNIEGTITYGNSPAQTIDEEMASVISNWYQKKFDKALLLFADLIERIDVMEVKPGDTLVVTLMPGHVREEVVAIRSSFRKLYPNNYILVVGYDIDKIDIVREVEKQGAVGSKKNIKEDTAGMAGNRP